jgi:hypothetical protein
MKVLLDENFPKSAASGGGADGLCWGIEHEEAEVAEGELVGFAGGRQNHFQQNERPQIRPRVRIFPPLGFICL